MKDKPKKKKHKPFTKEDIKKIDQLIANLIGNREKLLTPKNPKEAVNE